MGNAGGSGTVGLTWLGQSGYAIEDPDGSLCLVDPYLSDYAEEELGVRRVAPVVLDPSETRATAVVSTHWHHDHLDLPTCQALARANPDTLFVGPPSIQPRLVGQGVAADRIVPLERGSSTVCGPFTLHGVFARHEVPGFLTEDALGVVIEVGGVRILHGGDTEYDSRLLSVRRRGPFDVGIFVINGSGGNMNALEAALLAHQIAPEVAIPSHYGMWAPEDYGPDATLDPALFTEACTKLGGPPSRVLELGERMTVVDGRTTPRGPIRSP